MPIFTGVLAPSAAAPPAAPPEAAAEPAPAAPAAPPPIRAITFAYPAAPNQPITATGTTAGMPPATSLIWSAASRHCEHSLRCVRKPCSARARNPPRAYAPSRSAYRAHSSSRVSAVLTCAWRYACFSPSRAREASTRVPLASSPKSVATSLGDSSSTSVCHSTACHRSGSVRKARIAMDCSASCIASTSAPRSRVSSSDTSAVRAACAAKTAKSSTSCSRRAVRVQPAATRRTVVSR
ncbi:hypothetical protein EES44_00035 [Streptomyces sp. ADI96-15]|nr:hypothetical protein EES44_00035 [Streptomyces sp. ADI96-15]